MKNPTTLPFVSDLDDTWQSKLKEFFAVISRLSAAVGESRSLQVALFCLLFGIASSGYGIHSLFTDSHLICQDGHTLAQSNQGQTQNIEFTGNQIIAEADQSAAGNGVSGVIDGESREDDAPANFTEVLEDTITVDVSGAVKQPGLHIVPKTHRLGDVIAAAGGLTNQADAQEIAQVLNLASKLTDGQKIYIPFTGEELQKILQRQAPLVTSAAVTGSDVAANSNSQQEVTSVLETEQNAEESEEAMKISINTATAKQLMELKGIGEKRAADIIAGRPYDAVTDLLERGNLTSALFESLKEYLLL